MTVSLRRDRFLAPAYHLLIGALGWLLLARIAPWEQALCWADVAAFMLLSIGIKRLGFRVVRDVTHSLVGVVDLAALFSLGLAGGATVSFVSSAICQVACARDAREARGRSLGRAAFFVSGLNVIKAATAGSAYLLAGGAIPLARLTWGGLWPVLLACITWFIIDHVSWAFSTFLSDNRAGLARFLHIIFPYSLLIELLPLPISAMVAAAYAQSNPLFLLVALTALGIGYVVQSLMVSLSKERRHVGELSTVSRMVHEMLDARLDVDRVAELIYNSVLRITEASAFQLHLWERPDGAIRAYAATLDEPLRPGPPAIDEALLGQVIAERRSMLVETVDRHAPRDPGSALYVPIVRGDDLLGIIAVQNGAPRAFSGEDREALELLASQAAMGLHTARLYEEERQRSAQLLAIAEVSRKVAAIQALPSLFADTVQLVKETFGYYHVGLFTVDLDRQAVQFGAASSPSVQSRGMEAGWGVGIIGHAAASASTVRVNDVTADGRYMADTLLPETRAELAVPLRVEDRVVGVIDIQSDRSGAFTDNDRFVVETLAAQIAIAIEDNRLYQAQQAQAWVSTALQQVAEAVAQPTAPEDVLAAVARLTLMLAGMDRCAIFLWSEEEEGYVAMAHEGWAAEMAAALTQGAHAAHALPPVERARASGRPVLESSDNLLDHLPPPLCDEPRRGLLIALPLRTKGEVIGVLVAEHLRSAAPLDEPRMTILSGIANQAAIGLDNARLYTSQREEAWVSTALLQVATSISTSLDVGDTIAAVARLVPMLVGVSWSAVLLWDEVREAFTLARAHGLPHGLLDSLMEADPSAPGPAALRGLLDATEPVTAVDGSEAVLMPREVCAMLDHHGALAALPLRVRARGLGVLLAGKDDGRPFRGRSLSILSGIANQTALAVEAAQLYAQTLRQQRFEREIELAREIQKSFLPERCPTIEGWQLAARWQAARGVGGDFYDFIELGSGHLGLVIADVSDKGVAAALYMALCRAVVRAAALSSLGDRIPGPSETLERANRVLMDDSRAGMFVSLFYAVLEVETGVVRYARAGHNPPLWLRAEDGVVQPLSPPGVVLGIVEGACTEEEAIALAPGDALVMYTDGVTDALSPEGDEYGEERLQALVQGSVGRSAEALAASVEAAVQAFSGAREQFDDFTLVVVRRTARESRARAV